MLWFISLAVASELAFYPGSGDTQVTLPDAALLTGRLLAHVDDVEALQSDPDVASLRVLPGRGDVVTIVPRDGVSAVDLANRLHDQPGVEWAHPDLRMPLVPHAIPNDPLLEEQWHLINDGQRGYVPGVDVNAEEAWDVTAGAGVLVAVIDSGTDVDHPDLRVTDGRDYVDNDDSSDPDTDNHGTAVAGLVAAIGNNGIGMAGVAYDAEIYGLRILDEGDEEAGATTQGIYEAFVEAVDNGADVVNNSWGIRGCPDFSIMGSLEDAFNYLEEQGRDGLGTVNVFSAGNDACDITNDGILAHPAVIGVAAVTGLDRRASYSNVGPWVDISAPSNSIATTDVVGNANGGTNVDGDPDYTPNFSGTSASAPQVSGVAALMIAANPRITAAEVRQVLCDTSVRLDIPGGFYDQIGHSELYGCGRVDAGAAVRAVANLGAPDSPIVELAAQTTNDAVVLTWPESTDPDGDLLRYRVRWAWSGSPDDEVVELVDEARLDITEFVGSAEGSVLWRVRAIDPWGPGDWSETQELTLVAPEVDGGGCQHGSGQPWAWLLPGLLLTLRRRARA